MVQHTEQPLIAKLQQTIHRQLAGRIPEGPFALLDFPDYSNVGDSAIWLGEMAYLRQEQGRLPVYVSGYGNFDPETMARRIGDGAILLNGGGNFGDLWVRHQDFRENVIDRFRDRPIIQMPQSIHYGDTGKIAETARIIDRHPRFLLLVRDQPSFDLASRHFACEVLLCPDAAVALGAQQPSAPRFDVLAMLRDDTERVVHDAMPQDVPVEDWLGESRTALRIARKLARARGLLQPEQARLFEYQAVARMRVQRGLRQLARGRAIVTDRLHVHILALLLGIPHIVLDNSYGKIGRFLDAFSGVSDLVTRADKLSDAVEWAKAAAAKSVR